MLTGILLFVFIGIVLGVLFGLIPGLHPNLIVVLIPLFIALDLGSINMLVLITAMAISNSIIDFIPSILLGAPDSGNELAILPGHRMLMQGHGYEAIKLTVIGGVGSAIFCTGLFPVLFYFIPSLYNIAQPYIYLLLIFIVLVMIFTERGIKKRLIASSCFFLAGMVGVFSGYLPIDSSVVLFPILSGLFGMSFLILQLRKQVTLPEQRMGDFFISGSVVKRGVLSGTAGGIFSGLVPGVGSSEIATLVSVDKNDRSFLVTIGALTTANIIISILSLWLIGKGRSGAAVMIGQLVEIGINEVMIILAVGLIVCGIAAVITLFLARKFITIINRFSYSAISLAVLIFLILLVILFSGFYGLLLAAICTCLGLTANLNSIKRGNLMGVLILPTVLFYMGL